MKRHLTDSEAAYKRRKEDREKLQRLAGKITKVPESVRVYSNPLMKKIERRE